MSSPTKKQTALLEYIGEFTASNGFSPSYREIMRALNLSSVSSVAEHIENCVSAGYLKKVPGAPRSLEVVKPVDIDLLISGISRVMTESKISEESKRILKDTAKVLTQLKE